MPLELPNLDDRSFEDLVSEGIEIIPEVSPDWTDYNATDPGITLIELFAYISDILIYRLNQVADDNVIQFLKLLRGPLWEGPQPGEKLTDLIRKTMQEIRKTDRAVTPADFCELALKAAGNRVSRAHCVPGKNLDLKTKSQKTREGHISVVIVPNEDEKDIEDLKRTVKEYLEPRRLITTQVNVAKAKSIEVDVQLTLHAKDDFPLDQVKEAANLALRRFFDPLLGGFDGQGWPFGRDVYVSDVYKILNRVEGVDFTSKTTDQVELWTKDNDRFIFDNDTKPPALVSIQINSNELVKPLETYNLTVMSA